MLKRIREIFHVSFPLTLWVIVGTRYESEAIRSGKALQRFEGESVWRVVG